jgi:hypothetical protein
MSGLATVTLTVLPRVPSRWEITEAGIAGEFPAAIERRRPGLPDARGGTWSAALRAFARGCERASFSPLVPRESFPRLTFRPSHSCQLRGATGARSSAKPRTRTERSEVACLCRGSPDNPHRDGYGAQAASRVVLRDNRRVERARRIALRTVTSATEGQHFHTCSALVDGE